MTRKKIHTLVVPGPAVLGSLGMVLNDQCGTVSCQLRGHSSEIIAEPVTHVPSPPSGMHGCVCMLSTYMCPPVQTHVESGDWHQDFFLSLFFAIPGRFG